MRLAKTPPCDLEAEAALLGSLILTPSVIDEITQEVAPSDFFSEGNRVLFDTIVGIFEAHRTLDLQLIVSTLKSAKMYEAIGGARRLAELSGAVASAANARYYARIVAEKSQRRKMILIAREMMESSYDESMDVLDIREVAEAKMTTGIVGRQDEIVPIADAMEQSYQALLKAKKTGKSVGMHTGFPNIDLSTGGLHKGEMTILGARPSVGKTALAEQIGMYAATKGAKVLFLSLEMLARDLGSRALSRSTQIENRLIRNAQTDAQQMSTMEETIQSVRGVSLNIWKPKIAPKVSRIAAMVRLLHATTGIDLLIVDYLQLIRPATHRATRAEQVGEISCELKWLIQEMEIPSLILCQLNRGAEGSEPTVSSLKESGTIEENADSIFLLHRERGKPETKLIFGKCRNAPVGYVHLSYDGAVTSFCDAAPEDAYEEYDAIAP